MDNVGEIYEIREKYAKVFEWRIKDFLLLSKGFDAYSPPFSFNGKSYVLKIFPYGDISFNGVECIDLRFLRNGSFTTGVIFSLALKNKDGEKLLERHHVGVFNNDCRYKDFLNMLSRDELIRRKLEFLPSSVLTVVCTFPILDQNPEFLQSSDTEGLENLSHDLENILLSGDHSDTVFMVKEVEFHLHKSILAARNSYFDTMFKSDMKEKSTGCVKIEDCDPDVFGSFIHFLYSGKLDRVSQENVCELYVAADKYQEVRLKSKCLKYMLSSISADEFCKYFTLAFTYEERELLQMCIDMFKTKGKEIVRTVNWQNLLKKYPIQANELIIEALDHLMK